MAQPDHTIEIRIIIELRVPQLEVRAPQPEVREAPMARFDVSLDSVVALVAHRFELPVERILSDVREATYVRPRHLGMLLAREKAGATLPEIGRAFNRNHTTVLHGCKKARGRIATDMGANAMWRELCADFDRVFGGAEPGSRR